VNKYVIINGVGGKGKDTFVKQCSILRENVFNISTIDFVKTVAKYAGWDGKKDDAGRRLLSDIKDALSRYGDIPLNHVLEDIKMYKNSIVFIHCREPKELKKIKKTLNGITLLVENKNTPEITSNHADRDVRNYQYDYVLDNSGSLGDLIIESDKFLRWLDVNYGKI